MSKTETHFVIANIENISLWPMKKTNYKWFEAAPEVRWFFNQLVKRPALEAGWDIMEFHKEYPEYDYYGDSGGWWSPRYSEQWLIKNKNLVPVVMETSSGETVWYEKAKVIVNKRSGKHQYYKEFKTNEEAREWVEYLKKESKENFEIIINE